MSALELTDKQRMYLLSGISKLIEETIDNENNKTLLENLNELYSYVLDSKHDNNISVDKKHYEELLDAFDKLYYLEMGGVDNWTWYDESLKEYWAKKEF